RRRAKEAELEEEILAHLAIEAKQRTDAGESPEDARRAAQREFGSRALAMEVTRNMWGNGWLESIGQDLKYAAPTMHRSAGFTAVAILTLALGIGVNTAVFSAIDAAWLRPLPFPAADRLVTLVSTRNGAPVGGPSPMDVRDFARDSRSF